MPMANRMSILLDKIERRLGTKQLNLPEYLSKEAWAKEVISNETLDTFSRYFPAKMVYQLTPENRKGQNLYIIDEKICNSVDILGAGDIDWHEFSACQPPYMYGAGYGSFNLMNSQFDVEDIAFTQQAANFASLFSYGIYVDYIPPNMVKLNTVMRDTDIGYSTIPITLYIKHASNLMTIEPTKMELFERLAQADVATFLFQNLKYYDGVETVLATTDLKLSTLEEASNARTDVVQELKDSYVTASNKNQPVILTIN